MSKINAPLLAFNRGIVSPKALARTDVERIRLSCEEMTNWYPKTQGCMFLRPGTTQLGSSTSDKKATWIPFVASTTDTALLEITDQNLRIWISDALLTRPSVSTSISNGTFSSSTGWTDSSTGGGTLTFGGSGLVLNAVNRGGTAKCTRSITVSAPDQNVEHALRIVVARGPVTFRCGSTSGGDEYITETTLGTGTHSLSFTPTGTPFYLQIQSVLDIDRIVTSIAIEAAGAVSITAPWLEADLLKMKWEESADVVFVACDGYQQRRIERRGTGRSWSVIKYVTDDGPFFVDSDNVISLKPGATHGNTTLTASAPLFKSTHVGGIFRLFHSGYKGTFLLGAEDQYTDAIRVTGIFTSGASSDRNWTFTTTGTWVGTMTVQRSFDGADSGYGDYRISQSTSATTFTTNQTGNIEEDTESNSIIYYRMGFKPGDFTSGAISVSFSYDGGGDYGICRILSYNSPTSVNIEILRPFTDVVATKDWREGMWSDYRGWPSAVLLYEGRLWWAGKTRFWGSVSDNFASFSEQVTGDSGPIIRSLGSGPIDTVNYMLGLANGLVIGTVGSEINVRSSSLDEPLTPTNSSAKDFDDIGSAQVNGVKIGRRGVMIDRSGQRAYEISYDGGAFVYKTAELTLLSPDVLSPGVAMVTVQRHPDTRIYYVLTDGTVTVLTYEPENEVICFSKIETDGVIEKAVVLPAYGEDAVYFHVNRTINGSTKRYLEKVALESEIVGGAVHKQLDCLKLYSGAAVTTITGLSHLEAKQVAVWNSALSYVVDGVTYFGDAEHNADGTIKLFAVSGGQITGVTSTTSAVVGLPYDAPYKSTKLAYGAMLGTALTQPKRVNYLGLIMHQTHMRGLKFGPDFDNMDSLPLDYQGDTVAEGRIYDDYDAPAFEVPGIWDTDSRLCLQASAPRPCTLLAAVVGMQTAEKA